MKHALQKLGGLCNSARTLITAACLAVVLVTTNTASAQVTLPDTGVDVGAFVTATITALGAVVLVVVGGYFAFLLVRKAIQWGRKAFG